MWLFQTQVVLSRPPQPCKPSIIPSYKECPPEVKSALSYDCLKGIKNLAVRVVTTYICWLCNHHGSVLTVREDEDSRSPPLPRPSRANGGGPSWTRWLRPRAVAGEASWGDAEGGRGAASSPDRRGAGRRTGEDSHGSAYVLRSETWSDGSNR